MICGKITKNSAAYVSHILSHLPSQFYCATCSKWFRQWSTFTKHTEGCVSESDIKKRNSSSSYEANEAKSDKRGRPAKNKEQTVNDL